MRKHLSRVMAVLLSTPWDEMLPVVSAAKERFTATPIDGIPESGADVRHLQCARGGVFSPDLRRRRSAFRLLPAPRESAT